MELDISVVLNIHRESSFILRTIKSLNEAAAFAKYEGIHSELVVVFDRSDDLVRTMAKGANSSGFEAVRYVEADHGSLGPARNTGIAAAKGVYVWLADADDLVSYNCISAMHKMAETNPNSVVFPEYLVAFGDAYWVAKYFDDSVVETADFVYGHPYISRIFLRRDIFADLQFDDLRLTQGFAFEDWHLNCELRARGFSFLVAPKTVFFYRQRKGSLLKEANAVSARQIPNASLFDPIKLTQLVTAEKLHKLGDSGPLNSKESARRGNSKEQLLADITCMEMVYAAIQIDPGINLWKITNSGSWSNIFPDQHWGHDYVTACSVVGDGAFTDIVLLPWLNAGGGERFILDVLRSLAAETENFKCLVISGEFSAQHMWIDRLPLGSVFIDMVNLFPALDDSERDQLVLRLVLATSVQSARLHLKSSSFALRWFSRFSACMRSLSPIYYRFSDEVIRANKVLVTLGQGFGFLSEEIEKLSMVITDHQKIVDHDVEKLGVFSDKWQCVYAAVTHSEASTFRTAPLSYRLLWASRLCPEKRPELLPKIIAVARERIPDLHICVYGSIENVVSYERLFDANGLSYLGPFSQFEDVNPHEYDALLYTSAFDGLPNIILEAMSCELPVIAPDVGGISEAIREGETGFLVKNYGDEDQLVEAYVNAILRLYADSDRTGVIANTAKELINSRHNVGAHRKIIRQLFIDKERP